MDATTRFRNAAGAAVAGALARDIYRSGANTLKRASQDAGTWMSRRQKYARRAKYRVPRHIPYVQTHTKRFVLGYNQTSRKNETLAQFELSAIAGGTSSINRERNHIVFRGVSVQMHAYPESTYNPTLRVICLQLKHANDAEALSTQVNDDFFISNLGNRTINFADLQNGLHRLQYKVNRQKFNVFYDRQFRMSTDTLGSSTTPSYTDISAYIKVNKTLVYEGTASSSCDNPVFMCWFWVNPLHAAAGTGVLDNTDRGSFVVYFQDVL